LQILLSIKRGQKLDDGQVMQYDLCLDMEEYVGGKDSTKINTSHSKKSQR